MADLAAAIRDKINVMVPRLLPAGGTTGQVLSKTGAADYAAGWVDPAAGGSITYSMSTLDADVNIAVAGTWYSGPTLTLPAGTWLIVGAANYLKNATGTGTATARLWDGTAAHASASMYHPSAAGVTMELTLPPTVVVLAGSTTLSLDLQSNSAGVSTFFRASTFTNGQGNNASKLVAIRLA